MGVVFYCLMFKKYPYKVKSLKELYHSNIQDLLIVKPKNNYGIDSSGIL